MLTSELQILVKMIIGDGLELPILPPLVTELYIQRGHGVNQQQVMDKYVILMALPLIPTVQILIH